MQRKGMIASVLLCSVLALTPAAASANSGPAYWENAPSFSVTPLKDCPITVEKEDLSFDFSKGKPYSYSPAADVTAAYRMKNPAGQGEKVRMAFPLITRLTDVIPPKSSDPRLEFTKSKPSVSFDGREIPLEILPGKTMPEAGLSRNYHTKDGKLVKSALPGFDEILQSVGAKSGARKIVTGAGKLYRVSSGQSCTIQAQTIGKNSYLLYNGFNGMSMAKDGSSVTLESWFDPKDPLESGSVSVLALGGSVFFTPLTQDRKTNPSVKLDVQESSCSADSYMEEMLRQRLDFTGQSESLLPRLVSMAEDSAESFFADGNHAFGNMNLSDFANQERLFVLCYETEFPAGSEKDMTVRYTMGGAMESSQYQDPLYSYGYLLNPAKGWAGFKNLNVRITPPANEPYVLNSSLTLRKDAKGVYTAALPSLPQGDLTFSLYQADHVAMKMFTMDTGALLSFCVVALIIAGAIVGIRLAVKDRRRRSLAGGGADSREEPK